MTSNRQFEILYHLLNEQDITAKRLSQVLDVSVRTIYRDIERLSQAGIPVYTERGKQGGISLLPDFTLDKILLDLVERQTLVEALNARQAVISDTGKQATSAKLSALFGVSDVPWLAIDFSPWYADISAERVFDQLKSAILTQEVVTFTYHNGKGQCQLREVEPLQLVFKSMSWYLKDYCLSKGDVRFFKLNRLSNLGIANKTFQGRDLKDFSEYQADLTKAELIDLKLRVSADLAFQIFDDFPADMIQKESESTYLISGQLPKTAWLSAYLLSLGKFAEILAPLSLKNEVITEIEEMRRVYHK